MTSHPLCIRECSRSRAAGDRGAHAGPIPEECQGLGWHTELLAAGEWRRGRQAGIIRPHQHLPDARRLQRRENKGDYLGLRIQEEEQRLVVPAYTVGRPRLDGFPRQEEPHATAPGRLPVLREHF